MDYKVFISYSWNNLDHRTLIEEAIKNIPDLLVEVDDEIVDYGDEHLWVKIRNKLGSSDLVVALLSEESISSSAVIDELARANDRGINILPVISIGLNSTDPRIPYYLRQTKYIEFDSSSAGEFTKTIKEAVLNKMSSGSNRSTKAFSALRNSIVESTRTPVSDMILSEVIDQTRLEANEINRGHYEINLGTEYDFLKRAKPLFGTANSIYATTVSSVSSFWTDTENKLPAIEYLVAQKGKVIRIFVFDKPESLVRYREILDANYEQYGDSGAVFITSREFYLNNIVGYFCANDESKQKLLGVDFGVLNYEKETKLFAWLRGQYLGFKDAEAMHPEYQVASDSFEILLNQMKDSCTEGFNEQYGIIRWSGCKSDDSEFMMFCIDSLFSEILGEISHVVLFKDENNKLSSTIARVKHNISLLTEQCGNAQLDFSCNDVWFGENILVDQRDKIYGGRLIHNHDYKYMLYMRLPTLKDLESWYQLENHSELRKLLYCKLVDSVSELYDEMDDMLNSGDAKKIEKKEEIEKTYSIIEEKVQSKLTRMDYQHSENSASLVQMPAYPFLNDYRKSKELQESV